MNTITSTNTPLADDATSNGSLASFRDSPALRYLPIANVSAALSRMTAVPVTAGQDVVRQYEKGDAYYLIKRGQAEVWSEDLDDDEPVLRRVIGPGDGFEEEALILRGGRAASVRMITDGELLRLEADDFNTLIAGPLIEMISPAVAKAALGPKTRLLDVRYAEEHEESHIPGARLIPLPELRDRMGELDRDVTWLVHCKHDQRASTATCLLRQAGFSAKTIEGGIVDWPYETSNAQMELELISLEYCPYVQRSQITLLHNDIPHKLTYIDPDDKPDWFHEISPLGKVPVLRVNGQDTVFESIVINEFLRGLSGDAMLPLDPVTRAKCRSWIEYGGVCQGGLLKLVAATDLPAFEAAKSALETCMQNVEAQLDPDGPYFTGGAFSLVDATYAPFFVRLEQLATIAPAPAMGDRMARWGAALLAHADVKASTPRDFQRVFDDFICRKGPGGHVDRLRHNLRAVAAE